MPFLSVLKRCNRLGTSWKLQRHHFHPSFSRLVKPFTDIYLFYEHISLAAFNFIEFSSPPIAGKTRYSCEKDLSILLIKFSGLIRRHKCILLDCNNNSIARVNHVHCMPPFMAHKYIRAVHQVKVSFPQLHGGNPPSKCSPIDHHTWRSRYHWGNWNKLNTSSDLFQFLLRVTKNYLLLCKPTCMIWWSIYGIFNTFYRTNGMD